MAAYNILLLIAWLAVAFADTAATTATAATTNPHGDPPPELVQKERHGLKEAKEQTTVIGRNKKYDEITGVKLDKPRAGVAIDDKKNEGKIDPNAPHDVQEEQARRNLRFYTRIPNPIEYSFLGSGYFETSLYYDYWCSYPVSSVGVVNGRCATMYNMPQNRVLSTTMVATNGSNTFYIPSFTIHNDTSCVDPWVSDTYFWEAKTPYCQYDSYSGYKTKSTIKPYVSTAEYGNSGGGLLISSHQTAWSCKKKNMKEVLEYKIYSKYNCVYDDISGYYMKLTGCDTDSHTATIQYYYDEYCWWSSVFTNTLMNTEDCKQSDTLVTMNRGFFSYTCF